MRELGRKRDQPLSDKDWRDRVYDCYYNDGIECRFETRSPPMMKAHLEEHWEKNFSNFKKRKEIREKYAKNEAERKARLAGQSGSGDRNDGTDPQAGSDQN